jgi:hypothetical protein
MLTNNLVYPVKLYKEFEHDLGESETRFRDPMSALMDLCGSLGPGEQLWYQIIVIPIDFAWAKKGDDEVAKILGKKKKKPDGFSKALSGFGDLVEKGLGVYQETEVKEERPMSMMELNPKQKKQLEAIYEKTAKMGFGFKIRVVYVSRKEAMNKAKVGSGMVGYMKQFIALDLNNFKPDVKVTMTRVSYFHKDPRLARKKNKIISNYIARDDWAGREPGILNIEELATIWHFPVEASARSSMLQKSPGRKADAPSSLPIFTQEADEEASGDYFSQDIYPSGLESQSTENNQPPANLPTV